MKIANSLFLLFLSYFTFSQKTVNETQLTKSESKLFYQQELFSGMVVNRFANNQVKSIYQVNLGLVKGRLIEFWYDSEFKTANFQDTAVLNKLKFQLTSKSNQLEVNIQDSVKTNKLTLDFLNYEIGGFEKLLALEIKNKEGKLRSKKKVVFDKYDQLVQGKNSANRILFETRKAIHEINQKIIKETQKPSFQGKKSKELEQENFIAGGNAIIYDSLGNKFGEGNFIKGLQNGAWVYYFNSGEKMAEGNYLNGDGGNKGSSGIPKNGRDGLFNLFYKNGNPDATHTWKSGKLNGLNTSYYENGNKKEVSNYKDGVLDGAYNSYYENGKSKVVSNSKADKVDGLYNSYYENGNKKEISNYKAGKCDGLFTFYYENGKLKEVSNYKEGKLNGLCTLYYENGNKSEVSNYTAGKLDGQHIQYNDLGLKITETNYYDGGQKSKVTEYENGVKSEEYQLIKDKIHGPFVTYFDNGKVKCKGIIDSTYLENKGIKDFYTYNLDGSLESHRFFNKDGTEGKPKAAGNDKLNSAQLNKPYKCKCCKATINGLKNGYMDDGLEYDAKTLEIQNSIYSMFNMTEYDYVVKVLGFSDIYDYRRSNYKYCTLKCARTCH